VFVHREQVNLKLFIQDFLFLELGCFEGQFILGSSKRGLQLVVQDLGEKGELIQHI
jgi:hypothetical protein